MINDSIEKKVIVKSIYDLTATIAVPENENKKMPAVVLISGTGTADRDGNMPKFTSNIYKGLSDFFAGEGFVTIRYDKRGVGESKGDVNETGFKDLVDDVIANVSYLESLDFVDRENIILCGHSEGAMIATIASTIHKVAGIILVGGAGTTLRTALNYQNWRVLQEIKSMSGFKGWLLRRLINEKNYLKNVNALFDKCCSTDKDVIRITGKKMPAKWIREHSKLSDQGMMEVIKDSNYPILAVTGEKDVQANPQDINKIEQLKLSHVTCRVVPGMDHILRKCVGELTVLNVRKQYAGEFSQPIHEELLKIIKEWTIKIGVN